MYSYFICSCNHERYMHPSVTVRAQISPSTQSRTILPLPSVVAVPRTFQKDPSVHHSSPSQPLPTMADDTSYATFLTKANQSSNANSSLSQSASGAKSEFDLTTPQTSAVPPALQNLGDATYTSDADEPFELIVLDYAGHELPDATQFAGCVRKHEGDVEVLAEGDFDPQGQYTNILAKVKEAGNGQVRCYRVEVSRTRAEYYVVSLGERKLVGLRARAVES